MLLTIACGALCAAGLSAHESAGQAPAKQGKTAAQERYEQEVRDAAAARARYEAEVRAAEAARRRYEEELARSNRRRAEYDRRMAQREARAAARNRPAPDRQEAAPARTAAASDRNCEERRERSRRRGRDVGGFLGGIAGGVIGGPAGGVANVVGGLLPVGALIGEAIASLLDCEEQQQAATATEEAVRGGVGTTAVWRSETRPGVTGSSTVMAAEPAAGDTEPCLTVTDIVIVDGEETRAPKRMCRRPPSNRYVRV